MSLQFQQETYKQEQSHEISQTNDMSSIIVHQQFHTLTDIGIGNQSQIQSEIEQKEQKKYKNNLAYVLAQRMPGHFKTQVIEMVKYYQGHIEDQIRYIHKLVKQNHQLKDQIQQKDDFQNNKQNNPYCNINQYQNNERITQLEGCLMEKNKQIANLNKEITDLLTKVKKYKRRVYELQSKSPNKTIISESV